MARRTVLTASHLEAPEVVGRFLMVEGLLEEAAKTEAYCARWVSGGGRLARLTNDQKPVRHELVLKGGKRIEATLQCRPNVGKEGALAFFEMDGAPSFVVESEKRAAALERLSWGRRLDGGPQLEVTVFAARLGDEEGGPVQLIARTLCVDSKTFAKKLAPALYERRGELFNQPDAKGEQLSKDWARACARSEAFFNGAFDDDDVARGAEWVRSKIFDENISKPDLAAPKDKIKLTAKGDRATSFLSQAGDGLEPKRLVFRARTKGTRLKLELKRRTSRTSGRLTENLGRLDIVVDDFVKKNCVYPTGWLPLTHGTGHLQIRLYLLDPSALEDEDDDASLGETTSNDDDCHCQTTDAPLATKEETPANIPAAAKPPEPTKREKPPPPPVAAEKPVTEETTTTREKPPPPPPEKEKPTTSKPPPPPPAESRAAKPPPPPSKPPVVDSPPEAKKVPFDLAAQIATGAKHLKKADTRKLPEAAPDGGASMFDDLAAKISKIRTDVADEDDDDDDDDGDW